MLRKLLQFLIVGSITTVIAACYGVIYPFQERFFSRRVRTNDPEGDPVPELVVTLSEPETGEVLATERTDSIGIATLEYQYYVEAPQDMLRITIEDQDGSENGGAFQTFEGRLGVAEPLTIRMEAATESITEGSGDIAITPFVTDVDTAE